MTNPPLNEISPIADQLPFWSQDFRGLPNALARSALFGVAHLRKGERKDFKRAELASTHGIRLVYTGEELRQDDEDVFLQVLHLAKEQQLGEDIKFTANSMIVALGWSRNSESYERLSICMNRMKATALVLTVDRPNGDRMSFTGSLLGEFSWREKGTSDPLREWVVSLEKNIVKLFAPDAYSLLNWKTRMDLPPLAKWLHSFYSTHKVPFPHKVETLHKLTASETKELRMFRSKLKTALALLVERGFFLTAHIDLKSDLVIVERAADRRRLE